MLRIYIFRNFLNILYVYGNYLGTHTKKLDVQVHEWKLYSYTYLETTWINKLGTIVPLLYNVDISVKVETLVGNQLEFCHFPSRVLEIGKGID